MSKLTDADWVLSDDWAITRDKFNWILLKISGSRPRPESFYPTPELLLKSLHRKISRTMPVETDLLDHLEVAYKAGERLSDRLSNHIHASFRNYGKAHATAGCHHCGRVRNMNCVLFRFRSF